MAQRMDWQKLLSRQRFRMENGEVVPINYTKAVEGQDTLRTDFHIDYDRVVFSGAFRRLGRKTQVHPFAEHDLTHNRLTHSMEVASVGRSVGNQVGMMLSKNGTLPADHAASNIGAIVQVACLAHDLGNPPFGHIGEDALRDWFRQPKNERYLTGLTEVERKDVSTYEGNAHSLRIAVNLEMYHQNGGMRLSAASIGALLKYPWTTKYPKGSKKFNIYQTELPFIQQVAEHLGLIELGKNHWVRHPLSYLMEVADDICYALMDLEDAVELDLLSEVEVEKTLSHLVSAEKTWNIHSARQKCAMLRGMAIGKAVKDVAQTFIRHQDALLNGEFPAHDLLSVCSIEVQETLESAKELARTKIFRHRSKLITEIATFPCLGSILDLLIPAAYALIVEQKVNPRQSLALDLLSNEELIQPTDSLYQAYMKILDFVGGMTDNAAAKMAQNLSGLGMLR